MEERILVILEKHYQDLTERLESIEELLMISRQRNERDETRLDHFMNKFIALEASLDEKLGLWKDDLKMCSELLDDGRL